jgi:hypothetical protein
VGGVNDRLLSAVAEHDGAASVELSAIVHRRRAEVAAVLCQLERAGRVERVREPCGLAAAWPIQCCRSIALSARACGKRSERVAEVVEAEVGAATFGIDSDSKLTASVAGGTTTGRIAVTTPNGTGTSDASSGSLPEPAAPP